MEKLNLGIVIDGDINEKNFDELCSLLKNFRAVVNNKNTTGDLTFKYSFDKFNDGDFVYWDDCKGSYGIAIFKEHKDNKLYFHADLVDNININNNINPSLITANPFIFDAVLMRKANFKEVNDLKCSLSKENLYWCPNRKKILKTKEVIITAKVKLAGENDEEIIDKAYNVNIYDADSGNDILSNIISAEKIS